MKHDGRPRSPDTLSLRHTAAVPAMAPSRREAAHDEYTPTTARTNCNWLTKLEHRQYILLFIKIISNFPDIQPIYYINFAITYK